MNISYSRLTRVFQALPATSRRSPIPPIGASKAVTPRVHGATLAYSGDAGTRGPFVSTPHVSNRSVPAYRRPSYRTAHLALSFSATRCQVPCASRLSTRYRLLIEPVCRRTARSSLFPDPFAVERHSLSRACFALWSQSLMYTYIFSYIQTVEPCDYDLLVLGSLLEHLRHEPKITPLIGMRTHMTSAAYRDGSDVRFSRSYVLL